MLQQLHEFFIPYRQPQQYYDTNSLTLLQYIKKIYNSILKHDPKWYYIFEYPSLLIRVSHDTRQILDKQLTTDNVQFLQKSYEDEWNSIFEKYNSQFTAINHATSQLMMNISNTDCNSHDKLIVILDRLYHLTGIQSKYLFYSNNIASVSKTTYQKFEQYEPKIAAQIAIDRAMYNASYPGISYWSGLLLQSDKYITDEEIDLITKELQKNNADIHISNNSNTDTEELIDKEKTDR